MPKAGSTTLQGFLFCNEKKLKNEGILYPILRNRGYRFIEEFVNFRKLFLDSFHNNSLNIQKYNKIFNKIYWPLIEETSFKKIVFSDEFIFLICKNTEFLNVILEKGYNVKIITYIRNPFEYIPSIWQQHLKPGSYYPKFDSSLDNFILNYDVNYSLIINLIKKLSKNNVFIRPFEQQQWEKGNLISDFLSVLDCKEFEYTKDAKTNNYQYSRNTAEFVLNLNKLNLSMEQLNYLLYKYSLLITPLEKRNKINCRNYQTYIEKYSGRLPQIIETLTDKQISYINNKYEKQLNTIAKLINKDNLFIKKIPLNCGIKQYTSVNFSKVQEEILKEGQRYSKSLYS